MQAAVGGVKVEGEAVGTKSEQHQRFGSSGDTSEELWPHIKHCTGEKKYRTK